MLLDQPEIAPQLLAIFRLIAEAPQISFRARTYGAALAAISEGFGLSILNLRPLTPIYAEQGAIVRKPIVDDLPFAKLVVADTYGAEKPYFLQSFIATFRKYLAEIGTDGFAVRNPGHKKDLLFSGPTQNRQTGAVPARLPSCGWTRRFSDPRRLPLR